jgi:hypothetical protein
MLSSNIKRGENKEIKSTKEVRHTLQPSRRREAAKAVPETPLGTFGITTRSL